MLNPEIDVQTIVSQQIIDALQGPILETIRAHTDRGMGWIFANMSDREGNSLKIEKNTLPDLYRICKEVIASLGYEGDVDFYLTGNSELNAHSYESEIEDLPHLVEINSALFNLMTEDELKFVIGHEIGHLINHDIYLSALLKFVYPEEDDIPSYIDVRRTLFNHLSEFAADRYGYLANHNLEACISALYKLASGIDLQKMHVKVPSLISENEKHIKFFFEDNGEMFGDHPVNPLRVHALNVFSKATTQEEADQCIYDIVDCITGKMFVENDAAFALSAGLLMARVDGEESSCELAVILERVGCDSLFPEQVLEEHGHDDLEEMLNTSIGGMLEKYSLSAREPMIRYVIQVMLADGHVSKEEIEFAFLLGEKLNLTSAEIVHILTECLRSESLPKIDV